MSEALPGGQAAESSIDAPAAWIDALPDDLKATAEAKGWRAPADAMRSYQHLEGLFEADRAGRTLLLPKDGEDAEALGKIYSALGRPESAEGYGLADLFGGREVNRDLIEVMGGAMHEAGLSKTQARRMAQAYDGLCEDLRAAEEQRFEEDERRLEESTPPEKLEMARRAFRLFGLPDEEKKAVNRAMTSALGLERAVEVFAALGRKLGEDRLVGGAEAGGLHSPAGAERRMAERMTDKLFLDRYLGGEPAALAEMEDLAKTLFMK